MRREVAAALLITIGAGPTVMRASAQLITPPSVEVQSTPATVAPVSPTMPEQDLDPRSLANRAINRELNGDRPGAVADLSAAIAKESDPARRASMEHLLQLLQSQP